MVDGLVATILQRVKDRYPGIEIPGALRAMVTAAAETGETYVTECTLTCDEMEGEFHCRMEQKKYQYSVKVLDNSGGELTGYPEMIEIKSRQQLEVGELVQVVFLGNELQAALVGG